MKPAAAMSEAIVGVSGGLGGRGDVARAGIGWWGCRVVGLVGWLLEL